MFNVDNKKYLRFHQYTWGLQHFLTFLQEDIGHIKCYWFKINYLFSSSFYIANIQMWNLFWRWDVVSLTLLHIRSFFRGNLLIYLYSKIWTSERGYHSVRSLTVLVWNKLFKLLTCPIHGFKFMAWGATPIWFHQYTWGLQHFLTF
jgi:hypothetical protein